MALSDNLSNLKQRLISTIPVNLGVRQYQTVVLLHGINSYSFTAKVTEPTPSMLINFLSLGVTINGENRMIASIPLAIPEAAVRYGTFTLADGSTGESKYVMSTATVERSALVTLFRTRT